MRPASRTSVFHFRSIITTLCVTLGLAIACTAQYAPKSPPASGTQDSGTSTDLFIMLGSDFVRPGLLPKANYNIGIGHTFSFLKKDPLRRRTDVFLHVRGRRFGFLAFPLRVGHGELWRDEKLRLAQDEASQWLYVDSGRNHDFDGKRNASEPLL
jgi:hypothetical protein